jgi:hypothetical protein
LGRVSSRAFIPINGKKRVTRIRKRFIRLL